MRLLSLHNHVRQFLILNLFIIYILLVLFLWRTLTNTDFSTESGFRGTEYVKDEFSKLVSGFLELAI